MTKLSFSGHETFICKAFWLKKGFDFVNSKHKFSDKSAVVNLGVGNNMVSSIRFWLKSFGLTDNNDQLTDIAHYLFDEKGKDPYLEYIGSIWLLHYYLVTTNKASIYNLIFNEFRKERIDFTSDQLHSYLKRKCEETHTVYNSNTINRDINVFIRNYTKPINGKVNIEDDFYRLFIELELVNFRINKDSEGENLEWFQIESKNRTDLPYQLVLFSILNNIDYGTTISLKELEVGINSPASVFAINKECLLNKIQEITNLYIPRPLTLRVLLT